MNTWLPNEMKFAPPLDQNVTTTPIKKRYALLINPFYPKDPHASFGKHVLTPTLALTSIAATTPPHWEVKYWDENLLQGSPPINPVPEVVGITVHLTFAERAYELARWYRARGSKIILGGLHVLSCPEEAAPHADAIAIGEGVQLWPLILNDIEKGQLKSRYVAGYETPYEHDPAPRRSLLPRGSFLTTSSLIATRGCHNRCGFCYLSTEGLRIPYQTRQVEQIVQEFSDNGEPYGVFVDNNLGSKPDYLRALCRALRPLKKIWSAAVTLDITNDSSLIREMALGGCTGVFIGFESLTNENLADAKKKTPRTEDYANRVKILHDHGIQVNASFVLGFDHDRADVFQKTADWVEENKIECATFHILTPYPGTPLFRQMKQENRLLHSNWNLYDTSHVVFKPKNLTVEELQAGYEWIYKRLFSHASIWKRRPADGKAVLPYLAMSYLYKRSNRFWHMLIRHRLVHVVWRPLVEWTRLRHLGFRKRLEALTMPASYSRPIRSSSIVSAGV